MTLFQQSTLEEESRAQRADRVTAEHVVAAGAAGLPPAVVEELSGSSYDVVGLADTSVYANFELDPYAAKVIVGETLEGLLDLGVVRGSLATLAKGEVALSEDAAAGLGAKVGEPVDLHLGDGTQQDFTLVAVYDKSARFRRRPAAVGVGGRSPDRRAAVAGAGRRWRRPVGGDTAAVEALHRDHPTAVVGGPDIIAAAEDANADTQAWVNYLLLGLVIAFSAFAVLNTLMLAIRGRSQGVRTPPAHRRLAAAGAQDDAHRGPAPGPAGVDRGSCGRGGHADAVRLRRHGVVPAQPPGGHRGSRARKHGGAGLARDDGAHPRHHADPAGGRHRHPGLIHGRVSADVWDVHRPGRPPRRSDRGRRAGYLKML